VTGPRYRRRGDTQLLYALDRLAAPPRRPSLPGVIWTWRKEFGLLACATALFVAVAGTFGVPWAVLGLSAMLGALSPPWSERLTAFGWQLITPHLIRSALYQARIQNRSGRRPMILRVSPEPFGQRVSLRCPPGVCAEAIQAARRILRAACRAADVRVTRDERRSHIVTVDVIRHGEDHGAGDGSPRAAA
jgi:hypothetical protein